MKTKFSFLALILLSVSLTACQQPQNQVTPAENVVTPLPPQTPTTPAVEVETATEPMTEETQVEETVTEEPMDPMEAEMNQGFSLDQSLSLLNDFRLNDESQFANCTYSSIVSCQEQTANQVAQAASAPDACDAIMDENQVSNCKNQLWYQLASVDTDPELCDNITEEFLAQSCANDISIALATTQLDPAVCDAVTDPYRLDDCKNQVIIAQATQALDVAVCDNVQMYEYSFAPVETAEGEEPIDTATLDENQEVIRTEVSAEQNFMRQDCISNVTMEIEMRAAEEAANAEIEALNETPVEEATGA